MRKTIRVALNIAVMGTLLASCTQAAERASAPPSSPTPIPSPPLGVEACGGFGDGNPDPAPVDGDADGTHMAYLVEVDPEALSVTYDVIQCLGGEEANEAYRRETGDDSGPPNDYYIVNESPALRTRSVVDGACIAVFETGGPHSDKSLPDLTALAQFLEVHRGGDPESQSDPFRITKESGEITAIQQQWRP
jgi:hypothetical protein